jgi:hypothetical protein
MHAARREKARVSPRALAAAVPAIRRAAVQVDAGSAIKRTIDKPS